MDRIFTTESFDAQKTYYHGSELLLEFYAPLRPNLLELLKSRSEAPAFTRYIDSQPCAHARKTLSILTKDCIILAPRDIAHAIYKCVIPEIKDALKDKNLMILFLVPNVKSSASLAFLMFLHMSRQDTSVLKAISSGRISMATVDDSNTSAEFKRPDTVILLEDVLYTGGGMVEQIERLAEHKFRNKKIFVDVICPFATYEAIDSIECALDTAGLRAYVGTCHGIKTIFQDMVVEDVLSMDIFFSYLAPYSNTKSYIFDILHFDDRHTMTIMPHKLSNMSILPYTFLHTLPPFPSSQASQAYVFRSREAVRAFISKYSIALGNSSGRNSGRDSDIDYRKLKEARHARIAADVCEIIQKLSAKTPGTKKTLNNKKTLNHYFKDIKDIKFNVSNNESVTTLEYRSMLARFNLPDK